MATINYTGPDELEGLLHIFDLEFELLDGTSGRATAAGLDATGVVSMTETALFDSGFSVNTADIYDVVYVGIDLNYVDPTDSYTSIIVGTTASG